MRALQADHEPEGWPAVQMRDITALVWMVEALRADLAKWREPEDDFATEWAMLHGDSES
jgi:hypothetical protein